MGSSKKKKRMIDKETYTPYNPLSKGNECKESAFSVEALESEELKRSNIE
jgi:hypothetical protein